MTAKVITFGSLKGGAGKTKVSTNVAAELASRGHHVLIIDADPQGAATEDFGVEAELGKSLAEILNPPLPPAVAPSIEDVIVASETVENLHVVPASYQELEAAGAALTGTRGDFALLKKVVEPLAGSYDYIIIDTPPRLGELTRAAIFAADYAVPIVGPTAATYQGAISFDAQVRECMDYSPKNITIPFWVGANWEDGAEGREVQSALEAEEGLTVLSTVLPKSKLASSALLRTAAPAVAASPNAAFSRKVKNLVNDMQAAGI